MPTRPRLSPCHDTLLDPPDGPQEDWEALFRQWHRPEFLPTDPLALVFEQPNEDKEAAAFLIACLSLGRVSAIQSFAAGLLSRLGRPLAVSLRSLNFDSALNAAGRTSYRFFNPVFLADWLLAAGSVYTQFGSLEEAFRAQVSKFEDPWKRLEGFASLFHRHGDIGILVPHPEARSAYKRLNLFLRWMVRRDAVDPGFWTVLNPAQLFVPVDTHVLAWARRVGLTRRKQADRKACEEITNFFRTLAPEDPLRWDFALTRRAMLSK